MSTPPADRVSPPVASCGEDRPDAVLDGSSAPGLSDMAPNTAVLGALSAVVAPAAEALPVDAALVAAMAEARAQAALAAEMGEVPVGAVVLFEGRTIARAHNRREIDHDPLAHAEILALRQASAVLGRWRLTGCTLVVTLEPCCMCAGAIVNSRVDHVVFGAWDAKAGAVGSLCNIVEDPRLNHRAQVTPGVQAELARGQLQQFFAARRQDKKRSGL